MEERKAQLRKALIATQFQLPAKAKFVPYTSEYLQFMRETKQKPITRYEKLCKAAEKIIPIDPPKEIKEELEESIKVAYLNVTAKGTFAFAILVTLITLIFLSIGVIFGL